MGLLEDDVRELKFSDVFADEQTGATHVWLQQQRSGIEVYNGLAQVLVLKNGSARQLPHRFSKDLAHKINSTAHSVSLKKAMRTGLDAIGFSKEMPRLDQQPSATEFIFDKGSDFGWPPLAELVFQPMKKGQPTVVASEADELRLAWSLQMEPLDGKYWAVRVDAITGAVLEKENRTINCSFDTPEHHHSATCYTEKNREPSTFFGQKKLETAEKAAVSPVLAPSYRVFKLPTEAPSFGAHELVVDPADVQASPFGWHDTNGAAGAEFTTTRGNNVNAYQDQDGNNAPATPNDAPNGGAGLIFDFSYNPDGEPESQSAVGVTNLFYVNNVMHDFGWHYGFTSQGGNFQQNAYGQGGVGNDFVLAEARDGQFANSLNNANMATPPDGSNPRMQMFIWDRSAASGGNLKVNEPTNVAGTIATSGSNGWGGAITDVPLSGDVQIVNDGTANPTRGCFPLIDDLTGKIAMIDRGGCEFGEKALNAEEKGAIGCIICNFEDQFIAMGAGAVGANVTIPVVFIQKKDCDLIRQFVGSGGLNVSLVAPPITGPNSLDGDLDNGIIAHEYGHGISNRMVGGPSNTSCLSNAEQPGEGISDLMSLFVTAKKGDVGTKRRGVGTWVQREDTTGVGIRRYPYSTDMTTNPLTYADVALNTEIHATGEVFTAAVWEVYWAMADKYGFSSDLYNGTAGNNEAIHLFFQSMKLVPCSPGFLDFRDAMLAADEIRNAGANQCLIWTAFAKRGMGFYADQGSTASAGDQKEDFEPLPTCIEELKIKKTATPTVNAGEEITFFIEVTNHKPAAATGVLVTDEILTGMTAVAGSASNGGQFNAATKKMQWDLGTLPSGSTVSLTYKAATDPAKGSLRAFRDDMESGDANWEIDLGPNTFTFFELQTNAANSGQNSWLASSQAGKVDALVATTGAFNINFANPTARFFHQWETEPGNDGGFIESSVNGGAWIPVSLDKVWRGGYSGGLSYNTLVQPFLSAWSGSSNGWRESLIDLSSFAGKDVRFRFRYACDEMVGDPTSEGWYFDDFELLELFTYDGNACVTSTQGDSKCASAPSRGTVVNPTGSISADEPTKAGGIAFSALPNPAQDVLFVRAEAEKGQTGDAQIQLFAADGRLVQSVSTDFSNLAGAVKLDVSTLPKGVYLVRLKSATASGAKKVVIR